MQSGTVINGPITNLAFAPDNDGALIVTFTDADGRACTLRWTAADPVTQTPSGETPVVSGSGDDTPPATDAPGAGDSGATVPTVPSGTGGTTTTPTDPPVASAFTVPLPFKNMLDTVASAGSLVTFGHAFAPGDVPAGGSLALLDAAGKSVRLQQHSGKSWPDKSTAVSSFSMILPEDVAPGATVNYEMAATSAPADRGIAAEWGPNPEATLMAHSDLKVRLSGFDCGADTYTVSVNDILTNFMAFPTGTDYPLGGYERYEEGPLAISWKLRRYLKNDRTGASHGWIAMDLYVTGPGPTGPFDVLPVLRNDNAYGPIPGGDGASQPMSRFACVGTVFDGAKPIGYLGGANDPGTTVVANASINPATSLFTVDADDLHQMSNKPGIADRLVTVSSTGKLPAGGLQTDTLYWVANSYAAGKHSLQFVTNAALLDRIGGQNRAAYATGAKYAVGNVVFSAGANYVCIKPITLSATAPSGVSDSIADGDGAWASGSIAMADQGSGTITVTPVAFVLPNTWQVFADVNCQPFWTGTGLKPCVAPQHDFTYLTQKTKYTIKYNPDVEVLRTNVVRSRYFPGQNPGIPWALSTSGDGAGERRIGPASVDHVASIYMPDDQYYLFETLRQAFLWSGFPDKIISEKTGYPVICNNGPADDGVAYPGLGTPNPNWSNSKVGQPNQWTPWSTAAKDLTPWINNYGYGATNKAGNTLDPSHMPAFWPIAYLKTGHRFLIEMGLCQWNSVVSNNTMPKTTLKGKNRYMMIPTANEKNYSANGGQIRGWAWLIRLMGMLNIAMPDDHPMRQYVTDCYNDNGDWLADWYPAMMPEQARTFGIFVSNSSTNRTQYMANFFAMMIAWEAWRGFNPGFLSFNEYLAQNDKAFDPSYSDDACIAFISMAALVWGPSTPQAWTPEQYAQAFTTPGDVFKATKAFDPTLTYIDARPQGETFSNDSRAAQKWGPPPSGLPGQDNCYTQIARARANAQIEADPDNPKLIYTKNVKALMDAIVEKAGGFQGAWRQKYGVWLPPSNTDPTAMVCNYLTFAAH